MPPRSTGPKVSERDTLPTSVKTQMSGRVLHCTVQTLPRNTEIVLICSGNLSVSVGDNYETPCLLLAADEHVSSNVVNLVNLVRRCATNLGPTRRNTWRGTECMSVLLAQYSFFCSAVFDFNPVPSVHSWLNHTTEMHAARMRSAPV